MKALSLTLVLAFLVGCATSSKALNKISVGMDKETVISKMGEPSSTKAQDGYEVLEYTLNEDVWTGRDGLYWVVLDQGRVRQYGRAGDFGTMARPSQTINVNHNITTQSK